MTDIEKIKAEIERRKKIHFEDYHIKGNNNPADYGACNALTQLLSFIDTLEVEGVDLEKEINLWFDYGFPNDDEFLDYIKETAKHFYELGLKAQKGE